MHIQSKIYTLLHGVVDEIELKNAIIENTYYENKSLNSKIEQLETKLNNL